VHHWDEFYAQRVQQVLDDEWQSQDVWKGIDAGMTRLAPLSKDIPANVVAEIDALSAKIANGEFHPFSGPIKNQQGELVTKAGQTIDDKTLLGMDFYVEGVEGQLK